MAIDQSQLLQMLLQGGGGTAISPTSGLQDPSLSGLALGPQGMGFGGGESLIGGGPTGFGGGGGGGLGTLDLSQLLAQLQAAPGVTGAGLGTGIGAGSLGGFGAGGQMGQEPPGSMPTTSQQGQAGLGAANTTAQLLKLLREGTGLGKALLDIFPKGPTATDLQGLNLPGMPEDVRSALSGVTPLGGPGPTPTGGGAFSVGQLMTPQGPGTFNLSQLMTPAGLPGAGEVFGPGGAPALAGELGPAGTGALSGGGGLLNSLGGLPGALGGAGVLSNLGFGALNLAQGNTGAGLGELLGTGGGLALGTALAPETAGLSLLLGGLGGGAGGLFGGLFGGGGPSQDWLSFAPRLAGTLGGERQAASNFVQAILNAKTPQELQGARQTFLSGVEASGVGGFASRSIPPGAFFPELPGATGTAHEGGQLWNPNAFYNYLNSLYGQTLTALQNPSAFDLGEFQRRILPLLQQSIQAPGGNTFGGFPPIPGQIGGPPLPPSSPATQPQAQVAASQPAPSDTSAAASSPLNLPGSPDTDLATLLRQMGLA